MYKTFLQIFSHVCIIEKLGIHMSDIRNTVIKMYDVDTCMYRIAGKFGRTKFGEFGKSSVIPQTEAIQISIYN